MFGVAVAVCDRPVCIRHGLEKLNRPGVLVGGQPYQPYNLDLMISRLELDYRDMTVLYFMNTYVTEPLVY